jgi:hypothetical protein
MVSEALCLAGPHDLATGTQAGDLDGARGGGGGEVEGDLVAALVADTTGVALDVEGGGVLGREASCQGHRSQPRDAGHPKEGASAEGRGVHGGGVLGEGREA